MGIYSKTTRWMKTEKLHKYIINLLMEFRDSSIVYTSRYAQEGLIKNNNKNMFTGIVYWIFPYALCEIKPHGTKYQLKQRSEFHFIGQHWATLVFL